MFRDRLRFVFLPVEWPRADKNKWLVSGNKVAFKEAESEYMNTAEQRSKTLFLNGKEVSSFELSGDETKDLAAAKRLLAEQDFDEARRGSAPPAEVSGTWLTRLCKSTC